MQISVGQYLKQIQLHKHVSIFFNIETYTLYHSYCKKHRSHCIIFAWISTWWGGWFFHGNALVRHPTESQFILKLYVLFPLGLLGHDDWNLVPIFVDIDSQMVVRLGDEKTMVQIPKNISQNNESKIGNWQVTFDGQSLSKNSFPVRQSAGFLQGGPRANRQKMELRGLYKNGLENNWVTGVVTSPLYFRGVI